MDIPFFTFDPDNPLAFFTSLGLSLSSISALFLSIYNWWVSRRGAVLKATGSYQFGYIRFQSGRKLIYLPVDVMNTGTKVGKVDEVIYSFNTGGKTHEFTPTRRVAVKQTADGKDIKQDDLLTQLPTLPVYCPPGEGISEFFEYYEDVPEDEVLAENTLYAGTLTIVYNGGRKSTHDFSLTFPERSANSVIWVRFD